MLKYWTRFFLCLIVVFLSGCTRYDLYAIHGQSSILSSGWKSEIHIGQTTEQEIVNLLGQPTAYYHRTPNSGEKYLFYSSTATVSTIHHYPFFPQAQFSSKQTPYPSREWFLVSKGKLIKHISPEFSENYPDLNGFIRASGPEYPYCEKQKCKLRK